MEETLSSGEEVFGVRPRPRVLVLGFDDEVAQPLAALFPTSSTITINQVSEVRMEDWDLLITAVGAPLYSSVQGEPLIPLSSLFVLGFGRGAFGLPAGVAFNATNYEIGITGEVVAAEFTMPPELPTAIRRLVRQDLVPKASQQNKHLVISETSGNNPQRNIRSNEIRPFLTTSHGEILAGSFARQGASAECWILPSYASPSLWAKVAISQWEAVAPDRFPPQPDWTTFAEWQTPAELEALAELQSLEEERRRLLAELDAKQSEVTLKIESRRAEANTKERSLLTAQGNDLVATVETVLEEFGFVVHSMDEVFSKGDLREDLRISPQDNAEWEAIVEVRGYGGGAAVTDLMRLQRFAQRYETDKGHPPSACWYIVNQFVGRDPAERPSVLASQPDEAAYFVDTYQGLLIDTKRIFRLWSQLQRDEKSRNTIMTELMTARGIL